VFDGGTASGWDAVRDGRAYGQRMVTRVSGVTEPHENQPFGDEFIPTDGNWRLTNGITGYAWSSTIRKMSAGEELAAEMGWIISGQGTTEVRREGLLAPIGRKRPSQSRMPTSRTRKLLISTFQLEIIHLHLPIWMDPTSIVVETTRKEQGASFWRSGTLTMESTPPRMLRLLRSSRTRRAMLAVLPARMRMGAR